MDVEVPAGASHYERCRCRYCVQQRRIITLEQENAELRERVATLTRGLQGDEA